MSDAVLYAVDAEGIAIITINRPEQRNCLSREVRAGLFEAWDRFEYDAAARIAILTGSGENAFCAGGDLKEMVATGLKVPPRDMFPVLYETIKLSKESFGKIHSNSFMMVCLSIFIFSATSTQISPIEYRPMVRSTPTLDIFSHFVASSRAFSYLLFFIRADR